MAAALAANTTLRELDLSSNRNSGGSGAVALFGALRSNHTLLELRLASTELDYACGVAFADIVCENSTLGVLDLSMNKLVRAWDGSGNCSWAQVLAALKDNAGLHTLSLLGCDFSAEDGQALAQALQQRHSGLLRNLELRHNSDIGDISCAAIIAACLKPGSSVASLEGVLQRTVGQEAVQSLTEGLRQNNELEVLDLSIGRIVGAGGIWPALFASLAVNTRVHMLLLRDCGLTAGDGQALANALAQRPAGLLRELSVELNVDLGDDACSAIIVASLKPGSALRKLNVEYAGAGLAVTLSLAGCLRANHSLEVLSLGKLGGESNWSELFGALAVNVGLRTLSITSCGLKQREVEALAAALQTNCVLQDLHVIGADLGDHCGQIVAGGLATNTTLRRLHLYNCSLGDAAAHAFCRLLQTNSTLRELKLGYDDYSTSPAKEALEQAARAKGCHFTGVLYMFVWRASSFNEASAVDTVQPRATWASVTLSLERDFFCARTATARRPRGRPMLHGGRDHHHSELARSRRPSRSSSWMPRSLAEEEAGKLGSPNSRSAPARHLRQDDGRVHVLCWALIFPTDPPTASPSDSDCPTP